MPPRVLLFVAAAVLVTAWRAASHALGRGRMRPEHVIVRDDGFALRLAPEACDGAELRAAAPMGPGVLAATLQTPHAPGSLSALFLYGDEGERSDEIDMELFNDGSRRLLLTSWIRGRQVRQEEVALPFDPSTGMHAYAIRRGRHALEFVVDGRRVARWTSGFSRRPMYPMVNVWWPAWLPCAPRAEVRELAIAHIAAEYGQIR